MACIPIEAHLSESSLSMGVTILVWKYLFCWLIMCQAMKDKQTHHRGALLWISVFVCTERTRLHQKSLHRENTAYNTQIAGPLRWLKRLTHLSCLVVELSRTVLTKYFCCNWDSNIKFHRVRASALPNETPWQFRFLCDFVKKECPLF